MLSVRLAVSMKNYWSGDLAYTGMTNSLPVNRAGPRKREGNIMCQVDPLA